LAEMKYNVINVMHFADKDKDVDKFMWRIAQRIMSVL
jgi:hypothetical protein